MCIYAIHVRLYANGTQLRLKMKALHVTNVIAGSTISAKLKGTEEFLKKTDSTWCCTACSRKGKGKSKASN